ncbi:MAG: DUF423 domain-containing protein [Anaerolineaceae bacterium]|nr:DUF423 domain-containing protein [Anaerolineaceae bacterium]
MGRRFVILGSVLGMVGVGMGAFGAHALESLLAANGRQSTYETAVQYQFIHALALLFVSSALRRWPVGLAKASGIFFFVGTILFSGSLYILAIFNIPIMGAVAPIGGVGLILGWLCLCLVALQNHVS